jgi:hypothetical protein
MSECDAEAGVRRGLAELRAQQEQLELELQQCEARIGGLAINSPEKATSSENQKLKPWQRKKRLSIEGGNVTGLKDSGVQRTAVDSAAEQTTCERPDAKDRFRQAFANDAPNVKKLAAQGSSSAHCIMESSGNTDTSTNPQIKSADGKGPLGGHDQVNFRPAVSVVAAIQPPLTPLAALRAQQQMLAAEASQTLQPSSPSLRQEPQNSPQQKQQEQVAQIQGTVQLSGTAAANRSEGAEGSSGIKKVLKRRNSLHVRKKKESRRQMVREQKELRKLMKKKSRRRRAGPEELAVGGNRLLELMAVLDFPANALHDIRWYARYHQCAAWHCTTL